MASTFHLVSNYLTFVSLSRGMVHHFHIHFGYYLWVLFSSKGRHWNWVDNLFHTV